LKRRTLLAYGEGGGCADWELIFREDRTASATVDPTSPDFRIFQELKRAPKDRYLDQARFGASGPKANDAR